MQAPSTSAIEAASERSPGSSECQQGLGGAGAEIAGSGMLARRAKGLDEVCFLPRHDQVDMAVWPKVEATEQQTRNGMRDRPGERDLDGRAGRPTRPRTYGEQKHPPVQRLCSMERVVQDKTRQHLVDTE